MKKLSVFIILALGIVNFLFAAEGGKEEIKEKSWYEKGSVYGKVYANFHTSGSDLGKQNAFEVNRAYFGYKYKIDDHFATNVKLDIGYSEDLGRRVAFFKNAYLQYSYEKLKVQFGIADAFQFKTQEKFWGYRYIYKSFQDQNKFGSSADIGVFASYKLNDMFSIDASINNGEGYGKIQSTETDNLKETLGLTIHPIDIITLRVYGDILSFSDSSQTTLVGFAGVKLKPISLGVEYVNQKNHNLALDQDFSGISAFATYKVTDKIKVFGRYDYMRSVEVDSEDENGNLVTAPWNNSKDGDFIMGGFEFAPSKNVQLSLNYRYQMYQQKAKGDLSSIYFNLQASF